MSFLGFFDNPNLTSPSLPHCNSGDPLTPSFYPATTPSDPGSAGIHATQALAIRAPLPFKGVFSGRASFKAKDRQEEHSPRNPKKYRAINTSQKRHKREL